MVTLISDKDSKTIQTLIMWTSLSYALGFITVLVNTAKLGIPLFELLKPLYIIVGAPITIFVFILSRTFTKIKDKYKMMIEDIIAPFKLIRQLNNENPSLNSSNLDLSIENDSLITGKIPYNEWAINQLEAILPLMPILKLSFIPKKKLSRFLYKTFLKKQFDKTKDKYIDSKVGHLTNQATEIFVKSYTRIFNLINFSTLLIFILLLVYFYIFIGYPNLPQSIGGGKPTSVVFLIDAESIAYDNASVVDLFPIHTDWNKDTVVTEELHLYYATNDFYYLGKDGTPVVSLSKDIVQGIIWQGTEQSP